MKKITALLLATTILAACNPDNSTTSKPAPVTAALADQQVYLTTYLCPDGSLAALNVCDGDRPMTAADPMTIRRHDYGPTPAGYQVSDAYIGPKGPQLNYSFAPFAAFSSLANNGGEVYGVHDDEVTAIETRSGENPADQFFVGTLCGGDGWLLWKTDTPTGKWAEVTAKLSDSPDPAACPPLGDAYTRYRHEQVAIPFLVFDQAQTLTLDTQVSEHFSTNSDGKLIALERTFFVKYLGRVGWEAWVTDPALVGTELDTRCMKDGQPMTVYSTAPTGMTVSSDDAPGHTWHLYDCRWSTNIRHEDGQMTGNQYGWPQ